MAQINPDILKFYIRRRNLLIKLNDRDRINTFIEGRANRLHYMFGDVIRVSTINMYVYCVVIGMEDEDHTIWVRNKFLGIFKVSVYGNTFCQYYMYDELIMRGIL